MWGCVKSEFYKIVRCKKYYLFYAAAALLWLWQFISRLSAKPDCGWLAGLAEDGLFRWDLFVAVFAVIYVKEDFNDGYFKNTYFSANKAAYVSSKLVTLIAFTLAGFALSFISEFLVSLFYAGGATVNSELVKSAMQEGQTYAAAFAKYSGVLWRALALNFLSYCARAALLAFFAFLVTDMLYVLGVWLFYVLFLTEVVYGILTEIINAVVGLFFSVPQFGYGFLFGYVPYGIKPLEAAASPTWWVYALVMFGWLVLCAAGGALVYAKKGVKKIR